ncbi:hypothetical protein GLAREA_05847 [Glarea lozoyensis ATCC 20868]|uniref:Uncharacterized protein n=1 Tax=Glarea lozoyensis (strain ATCC 20868 / MF5171) TaxID=1116229 RepID=S3D4Z0_GLAL2|nr:uncharacterized protein GLAREA_05847 [Glarea lozoyensis ATCC 20868]EPE32835.1 hypothetical protein GLAREA_05847 [Glarea lozoyensis ATCC 20868]
MANNAVLQNGNGVYPTISSASRLIRLQVCEQQNQLQTTVVFRHLPQPAPTVAQNTHPASPDSLQCTDSLGSRCNLVFDGNYHLFQLTFNNNRIQPVSPAEARSLGASARGVRTLAVLYGDYMMDRVFITNFCIGASDLARVYIVYGDDNTILNLRKSLGQHANRHVQIALRRPPNTTGYTLARAAELLEFDQNVSEGWISAGRGEPLPSVYGVAPL